MRKTKHIDIAYHFVRERVDAGELNVTYILTDDMVADYLCQNVKVGRRHGESRRDVVKEREPISDILWTLKAYKRCTSARAEC